MLKKLKSYLILVILIICLLYTLINSQNIMQEVLQSLNIFVTRLFPALFFFFILGDLLINYKFINILEKIFSPILKSLYHVGGSSSFVIVMSMFSGFPSGSKYINSLIDKGSLSYDVGNYLLIFTHFSNPIFILGTISIILNKNIAFKILIAHYLANFIIALVVRPKKLVNGNSVSMKSIDFTTCLSNSIRDTSKLLLFILGNSIFFNCLSNILTYNINNDLVVAIVNGFFDLTKGVISVTSLNNSLLFKSILITTFLSFGGINVHLQVKNIIKQKRNLKYKNFLFGRICQTAISLIILFVIYNW